MIMITTASGAELVTLEAMLEEAYQVAVAIWDACTTPPGLSTHCDGLQIWECPCHGVDEPEEEWEWFLLLEINYCTHER